MTELSVVIPGIRPDRWKTMYDSIYRATKREFEVIFVSPHKIPDELHSKVNIKYVRDFGSACRAACIGSTLAEGKYITWASDDGFFLDSLLDDCLTKLDEMGDNKKNILVAKFIEGASHAKICQESRIFKLNVGYPASPFIPNEWYIFNLAILHTNYFMEIGGWDTRFEATAFAHADLAARTQRDGANIYFYDDCVADFDWLGSDSGDHAPIHHAMVGNDEQQYVRIYHNPDCVNRTAIDLMNWKNSPRVWDKRCSIDESSNVNVLR